MAAERNTNLSVSTRSGEKRAILLCTKKSTIYTFSITNTHRQGHEGPHRFLSGFLVSYWPEAIFFIIFKNIPTLTRIPNSKNKSRFIESPQRPCLLRYCDDVESTAQEGKRPFCSNVVLAVRRRSLGETPGYLLVLGEAGGPANTHPRHGFSPIWGIFGEGRWGKSHFRRKIYYLLKLAFKRDRGAHGHQNFTFFFSHWQMEEHGEMIGKLNTHP